VLIPDLEGDRPLTTEVGVGAMEEPEREDEQDQARRRDCRGAGEAERRVIEPLEPRRLEPRRQEEEHGEEEAAGHDDREEEPLDPIEGADRAGAPGDRPSDASLVVVAQPHVEEEPDGERDGPRVVTEHRGAQPMWG